MNLWEARGRKQDSSSYSQGDEREEHRLNSGQRGQKPNQSQNSKNPEGSEGRDRETAFQAVKHTNCTCKAFEALDRFPELNCKGNCHKKIEHVEVLQIDGEKVARSKGAQFQKRLTKKEARAHE
jgi:hypothetical protein